MFPISNSLRYGRASALTCPLSGIAVIVAVLLVILRGFGSTIAAEDPKKDVPAGEPAGVQPELDQAAADALIAQGNRAMADSNTDSSRALDAALAFTKALHYYQGTGDNDRICELSANIYWCKKRMNLDEIKRFMVAKGGAAGDAKLLAEADALVSKKVHADDAQTYFDGAAAFAKDHPTDYAQITTRYFEVAERFPTTEQGHKAQALSLESQKQMEAAIKATQDAVGQSMFMRPSPEPAGDRLKIPTPEAERVAVLAVRKQYKQDYAKHKPRQRRNFITILIKAANDGALPSEQRFALFMEAAAVAADARDFYALLTISDALAGTFQVDAKARKEKWLVAVNSSPVPTAIMKLLDNPMDKVANTTVGSYLCLEEQQWVDGLPVLVHGSDVDLQHLASMELLKPEGAHQQIELGDRWYAQARKASATQKSRMVGRAYFWYAQAKANLTGIAKARIAKRMDDLSEQIPIEQIDKLHLTAKLWDRLPGTIYTISGSDPYQNMNLVMHKGEILWFLPHPTDTYSFNYTRLQWKDAPNVFDTNGNGEDPKANDLGRTIRGLPIINLGSIRIKVGDEKACSWGELHGEGPVFIGPFLPFGGRHGSGSIRLKVVVADDL